MKTSQKIKSELLLNLKDLEKKEQKNKLVAKGLKLDDSMERYNKKVVDAMEAPMPPIAVHYNEVVLRAVPSEIKTASGIILDTAAGDYQTAKTLETMTERVGFFQEILMVGPLVTEQEREAGLRPGRIARIKWDRFLRLDDDHSPGVISTSIKVPQEIIDGYPYLIVDKRDIMYTKDA